jgi:adenylate cyclase
MAQEVITPRVERRLAAIMASDVVGYSRLMGADEEGTLARLKERNHELIEPKIAEYRGHIVKTAGDGMLVEFVSPVEAVRCAVDIQRGMAARNANLPPDQRITLRMALNLGDVIAESGDLFGDSVNVVARLQALAEPGGIAISRVMRDSVRDKLPFIFADTGEHEVKNIARPVRVYALSAASIEGEAENQAAALSRAVRRRGAARTQLVAAAIAGLALLGGGLWWLQPLGLSILRAGAPSALIAAVGPSAALAKLATQADPRLSIVVLPFTNLSGDPGWDYFADGFSEDLTTDISRMPGSFVIARATAATYKGKSQSEKQIASELGVRYVVGGGIRRAGNHIRVNAQLVDGETGALMWAERYDRDSADYLQMQDEITNQIASALGYTLGVAGSDQTGRAHQTDPDSLDLTLRGEALSLEQSAKSNADARRLFERAVEIDPRNVDALVDLGWTYLSDVSEGRVAGAALTDALKRADDAVTRALSIYPRSAAAYHLKSNILVYMTGDDYRGEIVPAIAAAETSLEINPNRPQTLTWLAKLYAKAGLPDRTPALVKQAMRLSPRSPSMPGYLYVLGVAQLQMGHHDEAIETFKRSVLMAPSKATSWGGLTAALLAAGRDDEAQAALAKWREMSMSESGYRALDASADSDAVSMRVQLALLRLGRWPYAMDTWMRQPDPGSSLSRALLRFQADERLPETGKPDEATLARLGMAPRAIAGASQ